MLFLRKFNLNNVDKIVENILKNFKILVQGFKLVNVSDTCRKNY